MYVYTYVCTPVPWCVSLYIVVCVCAYGHGCARISACDIFLAAANSRERIDALIPVRHSVQFQLFCDQHRIDTITW